MHLDIIAGEIASRVALRPVRNVSKVRLKSYTKNLIWSMVYR